MDQDNFYHYLQKIFTSIGDDILISDSVIPNIHFEVRSIKDETKFIEELIEKFPHLDTPNRHIRAQIVDLDKIDSNFENLFPKNQETSEIFNLMNLIRNIKEKYSSFQGKNNKIKQLEESLNEKLKTKLVDNINLYIDTLSDQNEKKEKIDEIKRKCYNKVHFKVQDQKRYFDNDSENPIKLHVRPQ